MIITLAMNAVVQGLMVVHTGGFSPQDLASAAMRFLATGFIIPNVPNSVLVWAVIGGLTIFVLTRTTFGRAIYAIGNSERAAYSSGAPTQRVVMATLRSPADSAPLPACCSLAMPARRPRRWAIPISCRRSRRWCWAAPRSLAGAAPISARSPVHHHAPAIDPIGDADRRGGRRSFMAW